MRLSSRQRVAAWLLALPLGRRGEEYAHRGRLEMISFWLLCWKLLRATAGLRRATPELTDNHNNCSSGNNNPMDNSPTLTHSVTMEFSSSPLLLTDLERDNIFSCHSQAVGDQHFPEVHGLEEEAAKEENGKIDRDECDHLVSEIGKDKLGKSEEQEEKERREEDEYGGGTGETEGQDEGRIIKREEEGGRETEGQVEEKDIKKEAKNRGKVDLEVRGKGQTESKDWCRREKEGKDEGRKKIEVEDEGREKVAGKDEGKEMIEGEEKVRGKIEVGDEKREKIEGEDQRREKIEGDNERKEKIEGKDGGRKKKEGEFGDGGDAEGEMKADALSVLSFISENLQCPTPSEPLIITSHPSEQPVVAKMEDPWGHDLSNGDEHSDSHFSDCLQAELAIVYSDTDPGKDKLAVFASSDVTNNEEAGGIKDRESRKEDRIDNEEEGNKEEIESAAQEQRVETEEQEWRGVSDDDEEQIRSWQDLVPRSPASSTASSTDPGWRAPIDFCVHQRTQSENVSTEHLDFLLARQQWKKMEEEAKGQPVPKPCLRAHGSFQGTHTSLYPPTRSPRLKHREIQPPVPREPPFSSNFSPSSEDSGLDDSSYRSPLEEPESAVEREIRMTLEREESHRRERGIIAQGLTIPRPSSLQGQCATHPSAWHTPTLSISPSPSCSSYPPGSVYHEMTANNVIILEPDSSVCSSRSLLSSAIGGFSDLLQSLDVVPSSNIIVVETSNLIIRSASEFCLSSAPVAMQTQESTFSSNPFFKLRSVSSQSLVEQEIKMVRQREEEWRRQREEMWRRRRERYDTVLVSPGLNDNIGYNVTKVSDRCVSSPSSPSRTRKMERSSLSCDHKFPPSLSSVPQRQNAMAQRWEASLKAHQKKD